MSIYYDYINFIYLLLDLKNLILSKLLSLNKNKNIR